MLFSFSLQSWRFGWKQQWHRWHGSDTRTRHVRRLEALGLRVVPARSTKSITDIASDVDAEQLLDSKPPILSSPYSRASILL
uniref:Uncharacterized protein n=1 Tax=Oryza meridionalis TaxID=40149 RepID=A0A0E0DB17_9ORYZ